MPATLPLPAPLRATRTPSFPSKAMAKYKIAWMSGDGTGNDVGANTTTETARGVARKLS